MKIYGRTQDEESEVSVLSETTIVAEPESLRELASFLYRCADNIEEQQNEWEQELFESSDSIDPHLVVFNPNLVSEEEEDE